MTTSRRNEATPGESRPRRKAPNKGSTTKSSRSSPEAVERAERDWQCVQLRRANLDWQTIADRLGYASPGHAHDRFTAVMREYPREDVETYRDLLLDRHETILRSLWPEVLKGNHWAMDRAQRSLEGLAKLTGANRPEKVEHSVGTTSLDDALRDLEAQMKARAAGAPVPQEP